MADTFRYRYGATHPVMAAIDEATVVEIGDLLYLDTDDAKPAASLSDQGSEAANQEAFHDGFLGVAMQHSPSGRAEEIRVATSGIFEFASPSSIFELGQLIGIDENASGDGLLSQTVAPVANPNLAIGRCAQRHSSSSTKVLVAIESTVLTGGPQAAA
ncbi:Hypothetical protein PBC10988_27640 [Planctomycetales bacterium 10988]|nr:Hypothetical protein PBC10988_27640 [Planctomycetales bacterium 10988]